MRELSAFDYRSRPGLVPVCCLAVLLLVVLVAPWVQASPDDRNTEQGLLDQEEYRGQLEEVVVTGSEPEWRKADKQQQEWRPKRFELASEKKEPRLTWFPEYTKDERDNYNEVRDRNNEKAEFILFDFKF